MASVFDVAQRLQPRTEPRFRPADPLCDSAHAPTILRVDMQHAIGFAEADRPQHDSLGPVGPPHVSSVESSLVGN